MVLLHRRLPSSERYPLPPREITTKAVGQFTEPAELRPETRSVLTWLAHFGYGGATGMLYACMERHLPGGPAIRGPLFGLLVWAVSYLGLLPGLHVLTPATEHPARRNALMLGAHVVWGWCLALFYDVLIGDISRQRTAFHTSPRRHRDADSPSGSEAPMHVRS
jgi:putative membrane protein